MSIRRKIWQGWIGPNPMPEREAAWCAEMKRMNSDFEYECFGNEMVDRYANDPYLRALINEGEAWAFCCDRLRCLVLHDEGGIWLDPDCQPLRPLSRLNVIWNHSNLTFVYSRRSARREGVALHRGVTFADNTFLASAPESRVIKRVMEAWTPSRPLVNGHDIGIQAFEYGGMDLMDTYCLNWRYFYALQPEPDSLVIHDSHNTGSWVAQQKAKKLMMRTAA